MGPHYRRRLPPQTRDHAGSQLHVYLAKENTAINIVFVMKRKVVPKTTPLSK